MDSGCSVAGAPLLREGSLGSGVGVQVSGQAGPQWWDWAKHCWPLSRSPGNSAFKSPDAFKVSLPLRTNYLYGKVKKTLPELYAFTICLWLRSSASPGIGTPFSYAVPGQANEIVLIEWGNNPIELLINDKVRPAWMPPLSSWW